MEALEYIDWVSYIVGAVIAAVCAALSFRQAGKRKGASLFYYLLIGFFACVCMSDVFFLLTWIVEDYPFVFSAGDVSWVGAFFFLITAALSLMDGWTPQQRQAARKYRLTALFAPAVCVVFNAVYISIYPEILFNYLMYAIPTVILSYFTLWLYLAGKKGGVQPNLRPYHLAVLAWIAVQLFYDLFYTLGWDYGYALYCVICGWLLTFATPCVYFAARKGAGE